MSKHDEAIRKAKKEIERLSAEIEKKKARITELQGQIKQYEAAKARDTKFSDIMLDMMRDNGIVSEDDRNDVLQKMNEYFKTIAAQKSESAQTATEENLAIDNTTTEETEPEYESDESEETEETETEPTTASAGNYRTAPTATYQNPAYSYRPTNNGNNNS